MWRRTLESLLETGGLPLTAIPSGIRNDLEQWGARTGTLALVRQGRGARLQVVDADHLGNLVRKEFPSTRAETLEVDAGRARNLTYLRDTKAGATRLGVHYLLGKAIGACPVVIEATSQRIDVAAFTAALGCFALPIATGFTAWKCEVPILLVENQMLFDQLGWLPSGWIGILFHYAGNLTELYLDWLSRSSFRTVTLFSDYDGIGLRNYSRLQTAVSTAIWHWESDWDEALERYGNSDLWRKERQRVEFEALWKRWEQEGWPDPALRALMEAMRRHGRMLEQEWVLARSHRK